MTPAVGSRWCPRPMRANRQGEVEVLAVRDGIAELRHVDTGATSLASVGLFEHGYFTPVPPAQETI